MRGDMALDTSVLLEIALATEEGRGLIKLIVDEELKPHTTSLNITEALYVICRLMGMEEAERRIGLMLDSGYFNVVNADRVPISIVDCHTLALAREYGMPALSYRPEREFEPIIEGAEEVGGQRHTVLDRVARKAKVDHPPPNIRPTPASFPPPRSQS